METPKDAGKYTVKGGRTFIGRMFQYQEKTGMTPKQIGQLPYIMFVLGMLDAPQIDMKEKNEDSTSTPKDAEAEVNALLGFF